MQYPGEVLEVPGGLLDPDDVVVLAPQSRDGFRRDVHGGAGWHVVGDDRQSGELARDRAVPGEQALLGGPRVVRRDDQHRVRARVGRDRGQLQRLVELGRPSSKDKGHPVVDLFGSHPDRCRAFRRRLRRRLAGGPAEGDAVRPGLELPADQRAQPVEVGRAVGGERRDNRSDGTPDLGGSVPEISRLGLLSPSQAWYAACHFFPIGYSPSTDCPLATISAMNCSCSSCSAASRATSMARWRGTTTTPSRVAGDDVSRLHGDPGAGDRGVGFPGDVAPAENRRMDSGEINRDVEVLQGFAVAHRAVGDDALGAPDLRAEPEVVADSSRGRVAARLDDQDLAGPDLLNGPLLGVHPAAAQCPPVFGEQVLAERHVAQRPGESGHLRGRRGRAAGPG